MPVGFHIASAWVDIRAEDKGLRTQVKDIITKATAGQEIKIPVKIDSKGLRNELTRAMKEATKGQGVSIPVKIDSKGLRSEINRAVKEASAGQGASVNLHVNSTGLRTEINRAIRAATAAQGATISNVHFSTVGLREELNRAIRVATLGQRVSIPVRADSSQIRQAEGAMGSLDRAVTRSSSGMKRWKLIFNASMSVAPTVALLTQNLVGVSAGLISMTAAAGGAAGIFGIALKGGLKSVSGGFQQAVQDAKAANNALKVAKKGTLEYTIAQQQARIAQNNLHNAAMQFTPVALQTQGAILNMKSAWSQFIAATQPYTLTPAMTVINALTQAIPKMTKVVRAVAPVANEVASAFQHWVSIKMDGWMNFFISRGVPILRNFITIGKNVGTTIGIMIKQFGGFGQSISQSLAIASAKMAEWARQGGFERFLARVRQNAPIVKQFLLELMKALSHVGQALTGLGPAATTGLTMMLQLLNLLPIGVLQALYVAWAAIKVVTMANIIYTAIFTTEYAALRGATIAATVSLIAQKVAMVAVAAAMRVAAVAQLLWNAAMDANPIILIGLAIAALVAGIVYLATQTQFFQTLWRVTWNAIKVAFEAAYKFISGNLSGLVLLLLGPVGALIYLGTHWKLVWDAMKVVASAFMTAFHATFNFLKGDLTGLVLLLLGPIGALIYLGTHWKLVWTAMQIVASAFMTAFRAIASGIATAAGVISRAIQTVITWVAKMVGKTIKIAQTGASAVWGAIQTVIRWVRSMVGKTINIAQKGAKAVSDAVSTIVSWLKKMVSKSINIAEKGAKKVSDAISAIVGWLKKLVSKTINITANLTGSAASIIKKGGDLAKKVLGALGFADGGYVVGPGTSTSDSISARLSSGEFVMKAAAVKRYGVGAMHALNNQRYAAGGLVGAKKPATPTGASAGPSAAGTPAAPGAAPAIAPPPPVVFTAVDATLQAVTSAKANIASIPAAQAAAYMALQAQGVGFSTQSQVQWSTLGAQTKASWTAANNNLKATTTGTYTNMKAATSSFGTAHMAKLNQVGTTSKNTWNQFRTGMQGTTTATYSNVKSQSNAWGTAHTSKLGSVRNSSHGIWDNWKSGMQSRTNATYNNIKGATNSFGTQTTSKFGQIRNNVGAAWGGLSPKFKPPVSYLVHTVVNSGIVGAMNAIISKLGGGTKVSGISVAGFASGGFVSGAGSGTSDSIPARLSNGEFVMKAKAVQKFGSGFMHALNDGRMPVNGHRGAAFARGGSAGMSSPGGGIGQVNVNVPGFASGGLVAAVPSVDELTKLLGDGSKAAATKFADYLLNTFVYPLIDSGTGGTAMKSAFRAGMGRIKGNLATWVEKNLSGGGQSLAAYKPGAGAAQWTPTVKAALTQTGNSQSNVAATLHQMTTESGGNPYAVNLTDSNAAAGYPSVGLMQVIRPTFQAYAGKYASKGPFMYGTSIDPMANIYSSMKYAVAQYGSLAAAYRGVAYAGGGHVSGPGGARSDSIAARLSNGEFVMQAAAVQKYGAGFMHAINSGRVSGFASGGSAGATYTVKKGDTLSEIAQKFGTSVDELVRINNIQNKNMIKIGQVLQLTSGSTGTYLIKQGDTLTAIAKKFNTTVAELVRLNNIKDPNKINAGSTIKVPGGSAGGTAGGGSSTPHAGQVFVEGVGWVAIPTLSKYYGWAEISSKNFKTGTPTQDNIDARKSLIGDVVVGPYGSMSGIKTTSLANQLGKPEDMTALINAMYGISGDIQKAGFTAATQKALLDKLNASGVQLMANQTLLENVNASLADAQAALDDVTGKFNSLKDSIASSIVAFGSITKIGKWGTNINVLTSQLSNDVASAKAFADQLAALKAKGLDPALIQQVAEAGITGGGAATAATLLTATPDQIQQINLLQEQLNKAATAAGTTTAQAMYGAGVQAAQGLVDGLTSQKKAIEDLMMTIAKGMEKAIKAALGIASPSKVMADLFQWVPKGAAMGVMDNMSHLDDAIKAMCQVPIDGTAVTTGVANLAGWNHTTSTPSASTSGTITGGGNVFNINVNVDGTFDLTKPAQRREIAKSLVAEIKEEIRLYDKARARP